MSSTELLAIGTVGTVLGRTLLAWIALMLLAPRLRRFQEDFIQRSQAHARAFVVRVDSGLLFLLTIGVASGAAAMTWIATLKLTPAITTLVTLALLPRLLFRFLQQRRHKQVDAQWADSLTLLSGLLRAGLSLNGALAQLAEQTRGALGVELALMVRAQRLGEPLEQSLATLCVRVPTESTNLLASALRVTLETGGGLAEILERCAATIQARQQIESKVHALTAQGVLQAWVVGALPLLLLLVLSVVAPSLTDVFWNTTPGHFALGAIGLLELSGAIVIRKIVNIDV